MNEGLTTLSTSKYPITNVFLHKNIINYWRRLEASRSYTVLESVPGYLVELGSGEARSGQHSAKVED